MERRPNILLITSDQQHWDTLSCQGSPVRTPHLDALAAGGTRFDRAYCPNPTCTPTRATIITGQMPSQHGAYSLGTRLPEAVPTLGQALHTAGYRSSLVGKAHFQPLKTTPEHPSVEAYPVLQDLDFWRAFNNRHTPWYGFDHVELARNHVAESHVGQHYALWMEEQGFHDWRDHFAAPWPGHGPVPNPTTGAKLTGTRTWSIPERFHYNTWISERSQALLAESAGRDEPFFLWASFFDPHPPYLVPEPWASMYDPAQIRVPRLTPGEHDRNPPHFALTQRRDGDWSRYREPGGNGVHGGHCHLRDEAELARDIATYYGMTSFMDAAIGRILARLDALGLAGDTLVLFTTDHGHFLGQHGLTAKAIHHYEDLLRIPFIARWPGRIPAGRVSRALQSLVDLAPTVLDCCGVTAPTAMTGRSQQAVWRGDESARRDHVIVENRHQPHRLHLRTLVTDRHKLTVYEDAPCGELFDLEADPGELRNLWDDPAAQGLKRDLLLRLVQAVMAQDPLPMPRIAGA